MTARPRVGDLIRGLEVRLSFRLNRRLVDPTAVLSGIRNPNCDLLAAVMLERICRRLSQADFGCDHAHVGYAGPAARSACGAGRMGISVDLVRPERRMEREEDAYELHLSACISASLRPRPPLRFFWRPVKVPPSEDDLVHWAELRSTIEEFLKAEGATGLVWDGPMEGESGRGA